MLSSATIARLIAQLQSEGKLPHGLSPAQTAQVQRSLAKYSGEVDARLLQKILDDFKEKIATAQSMTPAAQPRGVMADLTEYVGSTGVADQIRFSLKIAQEVASGAGLYLNQNLSPEFVNDFPALEFKRLFQRQVPRGLKRGRKGGFIEVPEDDWPHRWAAAGGECGDDDWLPWEGDAQTGRGVALKSSGIWQALGDGAGDYEDTLGNPFTPFAFNSGYRTFDLSRPQAVKLGLIGQDEAAKPAPIDFGKLFAPVSA